MKADPTYRNIFVLLETQNCEVKSKLLQARETIMVCAIDIRIPHQKRLPCSQDVQSDDKLIVPVTVVERKVVYIPCKLKA